MSENEQRLAKESRQAYWSEIDETEKCHRLRQMVKTLQERLAILEAYVSDLQHHEHGEHGLVRPICTGPVETRARRDGVGLTNDVYF